MPGPVLGKQGQTLPSRSEAKRRRQETRKKQPAGDYSKEHRKLFHITELGTQGSGTNSQEPYALSRSFTAPYALHGLSETSRTPEYRAKGT